jgi:putative ABC transport system substrate-binding protein
MMDRRRFVGAFAGGVVLARSVAFAQPAAKVYRVGFFLGASGESVASLFGALSEGLRDLGYVEGRNVIFERRYADGHMDRLPDIAADWCFAVDVMSLVPAFTSRPPGNNQAIPLSWSSADVQAGFVMSLAARRQRHRRARREQRSGASTSLFEGDRPKLSRVGCSGK